MAVAEEMSPQQAEELLRQGDTQLVDVREPHEHEAGRIAGSLHIELQRLPSEAESLDRERPILFYCRSGSRPALAADAFAAPGYDARNLDGGLAAWGGPRLPNRPSGGRVVLAGASNPRRAAAGLHERALSPRAAQLALIRAAPGGAGGAAARAQLDGLADRQPGAEPIGESGGEAVAAAVEVAHGTGWGGRLPAAVLPV